MALMPGFDAITCKQIVLDKQVLGVKRDEQVFKTCAGSGVASTHEQQTQLNAIPFDKSKCDVHTQM